ncbi:MAG: hypothetical protein SFY32_16840 [Bacteroidota bacterium]|nr:hypothetical protein [Bacteroidota bacterium]
MKKYYFVLANFFLFASFAQNNLATWDFNNKGGQALVNADFLYQNITSATAGVGSGLAASNYLNDGLTATQENQTTLGAAITKGEYFSIHVVPANGYQITINNLQIRPVSQNQTRTFAILSNLTGYNSSNVLGSFTYQANSGGSIQQVAISGITNITTPIEFRIYVYGAANVNNGYWEAVGIGNGTNVDLTVQGDVSSIPVIPSWSTQGNTVDGTAFIGTTNNQPLILKANNNTGVTVNSNGSVNIPNLQTNGITYTGASFDIFTPVQAQWNGGKPIISMSQYGEIQFNSSPYINYNNIYLKGTGDYSNGLSYTDSFGTTTGIGGPVLFGANGGALGTRPSWDNAQGKAALTWDNKRNVAVYGNLNLGKDMVIDGNATISGVANINTLQFSDGTSTNSWSPVSTITSNLSKLESSVSGLLFSDGAQNTKLTTLTSAVQSIQNQTVGWSTGGNNINGYEFIGTTNYQPLYLRANGTTVMTIQPYGLVTANTISVSNLSATNGASLGYTTVNGELAANNGINLQGNLNMTGDIYKNGNLIQLDNINNYWQKIQSDRIGCITVPTPTYQNDPNIVNWNICNNTPGRVINTNNGACTYCNQVIGTQDNVILNSSYGYVGIGTNTPVSKLDVNGSQRITENLTIGGDLFSSNYGQISLSKLSELLTKYNDVTVTGIGQNQTEINFLDPGNNCSGGTASWEECWLSLGNPPNGTTKNIGSRNRFLVTTTDGLNVMGGLSSSASLLGSNFTTVTFDSYSNQYSNYKIATLNFIQSVGKTTNLVIADRIGIGTSTSGQALAVVGNITTSGVITSGGINTDIVLANGYALKNGDVLQPTPFVIDGRKAISLIQIDKVGIGTPTPLQNIHILGKNNTDNADIMMTSGYPNSPNWNIGAGNTFLRFATYNETTNTFSDKVEISSNGNVGIGINNPNSKLHVNGGIRIENEFSMGGAYAFEVDAPGIVGGRFKVGTDGKVGIGTPTAASTLHVVGTQAIFETNSDAAIKIKDTRSGVGWSYLQFENNSGIRDWVVGRRQGGNFMIWSNDANEILNITKSGNVGIGVLIPIEKFEVSGKIKSTSDIISGGNIYGGNFSITTNASSNAIDFTTSSSYSKVAFNKRVDAPEFRACLSPGTCPPDYVFDKDYKLMDIKSLKNYLEKNKHLPEVPSAKEMLSNGVNMSEMNLTLLKKVEEMTLYIIQLEERLGKVENNVKK